MIRKAITIKTIIMMKTLILNLVFISTISCTNSTNNEPVKDKLLVSDSTQINETSQFVEIKDTVVFECNYLGETPPGNEPKLFAPNNISTGDLHSSVYFTPDGKEVYYTRLSSNGDNSGVLMRRNIDGNWSDVTMVPGTEEALTPFISHDGQRLFCSLPRTLFVMNRNGNGWGEPKNLGKEINFQDRQDGLSESLNRTIYYTTMFGENNGAYSSKYIDGKYETPEKLETGLIGKFRGGYPYVAPDESYIIVQAWQTNGFGSHDLYIMFKKEDGSWTKAINMGSKINTKTSESFPYVTPDGKYLFFNSNRISEINSRIPSHFYGNIYWVKADVIQEIKEKYFNNNK